MALVNVRVYNSSASRTVVPWTIYHVEDERLTLKSLYELVTKDIDAEAVVEIEARVGKAKEHLDAVNSLG